MVGESETEKLVDVELRLVYETNEELASSAQLVLVDNTSALTTVYVGGPLSTLAGYIVSSYY